MTVREHNARMYVAEAIIWISDRTFAKAASRLYDLALWIAEPAVRSKLSGRLR